MSHPAALAASALKQIFQALGRLTEAELMDLAEGRVRVQLTGNVPTQRAAARPASTSSNGGATRKNVDIDQVVETIRGFHTTDEVAAYLEENDKPFTVPILKQIAKALGPTVSKSGNVKSDFKRNIVQGTVGFRQNSAVVGGGAYLS